MNPRSLLLVLSALFPAPFLPAQCTPAWSPVSTPGVIAGVGGPVHAVAAVDFGTGPKVAVGGVFQTAGGIPAARAAFFDGVGWSPVGSGLDGAVRAFLFHDDGSGAALFAGGDFSTAGGQAAARAAKFDGVAWSPLGSGLNGAVRTFAAFDDGGGSRLYAGGSFTVAGGLPAGRIARFDGVAWSALGSGSGFDGDVLTLAVFDDGAGPKLYAGGAFTSVDGVASPGLAVWNGASWAGVGAGLSAAPTGPSVEVVALKAGDAGDGPRLFAGGTFGAAGGVPVQNLAAFDGANWSDLGLATTAVHALALHPTGGTPHLVAAATYLDGFGSPTVGVITRLGTTPSSWTTTGTLGTPLTQSAKTLCSLPFGGVPTLVLGGDFSAIAGASGGATPTNHVAQWTGVRWSPFGAGLAGTVRRLKTLDLGQGPELYAGGYFATGGGVAVRTAGGFSAFAGDLSAVTIFGIASHAADFEAFDSGSGPELYAVGYFQSSGGATLGNVARLQGGAWSPLGAGLSGFGYALAVFDDGSGPGLFVGGSFASAGGLPSPNLARWNGVSWSVVGGLNGAVGALAVFDDGSGPALYAAGTFTTAGGLPSPGIARRRNGVWSPVGSGGLTGPIALGGFPGRSLAVFDAGNGPALYVGGNFQFAGGVPAVGVARWNGVTWSALGSGLGGVAAGAFEVALLPYATSAGPRLVVSGPFSSAGGVPATGLALFDGVAFSAVPGSGGATSPTASALTLAAYGDAFEGVRLYAGGGGTAFTGGVNIASWTDPSPGFFSPPRGQSVPGGATAMFRVRPTGTGPFSFQWRKDGVPVAGAVSPELVIAAVMAADGGLYDVVVTGACGVATSPPAPLWISSSVATYTRPYGPGSLRLTDTGGQPFAPIFRALSFDLRNSILPGGGAGCGLWITEPELYDQIASFSAPFFGTRDGGGVAVFEVGAGTLPPFLYGRVLYGVTVDFDPIGGVIAGCSNPASLAL